jgi:hypothetical protein
MSKVIYMEDTFQYLDKDKIQHLTNLGEVVQSDSGSYLVIDDGQISRTIRKTLDGEVLFELEEGHELRIKTKVPSKWLLQDTETGQVYRGTSNTDIYTQWELIGNVTNPKPTN